MYTLADAPVLGYDLVRRPAGHRVAAVLVRALALEADDLGVLAEAFHDGDDRVAAWLDVGVAAEAEPRVQSVMADAGALVVDPQTVSAMARTLGRASLGSVDALLRLVRAEVLDWTWTWREAVATQDAETTHAAAVVCDAATAGYLAAALPARSQRSLTGPWVTALRRLPERRCHLGPQHDLVEACVRRLARLDEQDVARLRTAVTERELVATWRDAVHDAAAASLLTARSRAAATAQMLAVEALQRGGLPAEVGAAGAWNVVSGYVQSLVVADVLDDLTRMRLTLPFRAALGAAT